MTSSSRSERARYFTSSVRIDGEEHGRDVGVSVLSAEDMAAQLADKYVKRGMGAKTIRIAVDMGPEVE